MSFTRHGRLVTHPVAISPETAGEIDALLAAERWENERPTRTGLLRRLIEEALEARRGRRSAQ